MTYRPETLRTLRLDAAAVIARYPAPRSALLPLLHLCQSVDGYVSPDGLAFCAETLGLTSAEVSAVATFYSQFKRQPNGQYTLGVCITALCGLMGGDAVFERLSQYLEVGHDQTTADGMFTLEKIECNAACDYAPVVMVNWEFFDNQTPRSVIELVNDLRAGRAVNPTRGPGPVATFKQVSRVLAGFEDGLSDQGPGAGPSSLAGLRAAGMAGQAPTPGALTDQAPTLAAETPSPTAETPAVAAETSIAEETEPTSPKEAG
ncbi:MAG: NADH-quinone oxidoreductase subunit NuoE [Bifidobacteriaceae bacterium]|jgi:NADH-quinone oxidoreductase subunit E|nr:NADH-quinone oxidoreductase subunit NuoE [Bifidobacteriaceae bacterium]